MAQLESVMPQSAPKNGAVLPLAGTFIGRQVRVDAPGPFANQKVSVVPFLPRFDSLPARIVRLSIDPGWSHRLAWSGRSPLKA